jgi:hypothetical protein
VVRWQGEMCVRMCRSGVRARRKDGGVEAIVGDAADRCQTAMVEETSASAPLAYM